MNILYLSWWLPYPLRTGLCVTNYNVIRQLAVNHEVSLVSFIDSKDELRYVPEMAKLCTDVTCVLRERKSMLPLRHVLGLLSPAPRSILLARSREMREAVAHQLEQKRFDCAIADATTTLEYALNVKGFPKVLFHHNVDSVVIKRDYQMQKSPPKRFRRWLTWRKAAVYERRVSRQADAHVMVSPIDRDELLALAPDLGPVEVVGNGVDMDSFQVYGVQRDRNSIVFASLLRYVPNRDGLRRFCREIFPEIRRGWENAVLRVTGHFAGMGVEDLQTDPHVEFTGYLDDVKPTIASSWVSIAPIHVGSGTRLKILEAMALGTPVVSTTVGAEGLDVEHERDILIADAPSDFAKQILRLHNDERLWAKLSENGRRLIKEKYDWKVLGKKFEAFLHQVCDGSASRKCTSRGVQTR